MSNKKVNWIPCPDEMRMGYLKPPQIWKLAFIEDQAEYVEFALEKSFEISKKLERNNHMVTPELIFQALMQLIIARLDLSGTVDSNYQIPNKVDQKV